MYSPWRAVAALALAPWLVLSPLIPPEHVHERDYDHAQATSHRHAALHRHDSNAWNATNAGRLADEDAQVVWVADRLIAPAVVALPVLQPGTATGAGAVPPPSPWIAITACDSAPPHGPPRACLALRAPPLAALLA